MKKISALSLLAMSIALSGATFAMDENNQPVAESSVLQTQASAAVDKIIFDAYGYEDVESFNSDKENQLGMLSYYYNEDYCTGELPSDFETYQGECRASTEMQYILKRLCQDAIVPYPTQQYQELLWTLGAMAKVKGKQLLGYAPSSSWMGFYIDNTGSSGPDITILNSYAKKGNLFINIDEKVTEIEVKPLFDQIYGSGKYRLTWGGTKGLFSDGTCGQKIVAGLYRLFGDSKSLDNFVPDDETESVRALIFEALPELNKRKVREKEVKIREAQENEKIRQRLTDGQSDVNLLNILIDYARKNELQTREATIISQVLESHALEKTLEYDDKKQLAPREQLLSSYLQNQNDEAAVANLLLLEGVAAMRNYEETEQEELFMPQLLQDILNFMK